MRDLDGKVAVVTGGGSPRGIGRATGRLLAQNGCQVVLADLNKATLKDTVADLAAEGLSVTGMAVDVADAADIAWGESVLRSRCEALVNRTDPDPYLWGMATK